LSFHCSHHNGDIAAKDSVSLELLAQDAFRFRRASEDEQAAGFPIQALHHSQTWQHMGGILVTGRYGPLGQVFQRWALPTAA
jgi:hypothetical protein